MYGESRDAYVVTTSDPQDVTLELVSESVGGNLLGHTLLVEDATIHHITLLVSVLGTRYEERGKGRNSRLALVIDLNGLLLPSGRVGKAQFHAIHANQGSMVSSPVVESRFEVGVPSFLPPLVALLDRP